MAKNPCPKDIVNAPRIVANLYPRNLSAIKPPISGVK